jgi:hypothetical protein
VTLAVFDSICRMTHDVDMSCIDHGTINLLMTYIHFFIRIAIAARRSTSTDVERILIDKIITRIAVIIGDISLLEYVSFDY